MSFKQTPNMESQEGLSPATGTWKRPPFERSASRSAGVQPTFGTGSTSSERSLPCLPPVKGIDTETGGEEKVHQKQLVNV